MTGRDLLVLALLLALVPASILAAGWATTDDPAPHPPICGEHQSSCCDPHGSGARIYPGTGIIESHDSCPQPPLVHAPEGTGPNTGPRGERE